MDFVDGVAKSIPGNCDSGVDFDRFSMTKLALNELNFSCKILFDCFCGLNF